MSQKLAILNETQKTAIEFATNKTAIIIAGPGSGKTFVIIERIKHLINNCDIKPQDLMIITFTNNAINEIEERLKDNRLKNFKNCGTLHALVKHLIEEKYLKQLSEILEKKYTAINIFNESNFFVFLEDSAVDIFPESWELQKKFRNFKEQEKNKLQNFIFLKKLHDAIKEFGFSSEDFDPYKSIGKKLLKKFNEKKLELLVDVYRKYLLKEKKSDFLDILIFFIRLTEKYPEIISECQKKFKYILVDEFQDLNIIQFEIIKKLSLNGQNLFVVGDPNQSIYGFSGADSNIFNKLQNWCEEKQISFEILNLKQNYRSNKNIVLFSNISIKNNNLFSPIEVFAEKEEGPKIDYYSVDNYSVDFVVNLLKKIQNDGIKPSDIVVLYRANWLVKNLKKELFFKHQKFVDIAWLKFIENENTQLFILLFLFSINSDDELAAAIFFYLQKTKTISYESFLKIKTYQQEKNINWLKIFTAIDEIEELEHADKKIIKNIFLTQNTFAHIIDDPMYGFEHFNKFFQQYLTKNKEIQGFFSQKTWHVTTALSDFFKEINAFKGSWKKISEFIEILTVYIKKMNLNFFTQNYDYFTFSTIHSSKGCEFKCVLLLHVAENLLPYYYKTDEIHQDDIEEERRLFYVAITRAKTKLIIVRFISPLFNVTKENVVFEESRFITEIKENVKEICNFFEIKNNYLD